MEFLDTAFLKRSGEGEGRRVAIVDDHPLVRRGILGILREQPDLQVVAEAACEKEALELLESEEIDLLIVDWSLKRRDSSGLIQTVLIRNPRLKVLVVSVHDETTHAELAIRAGARGYIMKQEATDKIVGGIRSLLAGQYFFSDRALASLSANSMQRVSGFEVVGQKEFKPEEIKLPEPFADWAVSVVIPVFNSGSTLIPLCERLMETLQSVRCLQIILVDDGSSDDSVEVCLALNARYPEAVEFIGLARNFGEHSAILTGLRAVCGDYCVLMDDDLQNPPEEVPALLRQAAFGFDVVYSEYTDRRHPLYRRLGSALHNWMANFVLQKPKDLYLSSFKVLSAPLVAEICAYRGPAPYLDALIFRATSNVGTVHARHEVRPRGRSGYSLAKLFCLWWRLVFGFSNWLLRAACLLAVAGLFLMCSWETSVAMGVDSGLKVAGIVFIGVAFWVAAEHLGSIREMQLGAPPVLIRSRYVRSQLQGPVCSEKTAPKTPAVR